MIDEIVAVMRARGIPIVDEEDPFRPVIGSLKALGKNRIAGVIASSAGYPDARPRASVPFAVFGTAGTDDFNYSEMRQLERALQKLSPDEAAASVVAYEPVWAIGTGRTPSTDDVAAASSRAVTFFIR